PAAVSGARPSASRPQELGHAAPVTGRLPGASRVFVQPVADLLGIDAPAAIPLGAPFFVTVRALETDFIDVFPAPRYRGTVRFTSSDPGAFLPTSYTFTEQDQGQHAFLVVLATPGRQTITVTDTTTGALMGSTTVDVTLPVADVAVTLTPDRAAITIGESLGFTLTVTNLGPHTTGFVNVTVGATRDAVFSGADFVELPFGL